MQPMGFYEVVETVGKVIDGIGVAIIAVGLVIAAGNALGRMLRKSTDVYQLLRGQLGRAILLGLEFLVAADIIRTVAVRRGRVARNIFSCSISAAQAAS